MNLVDQIFEQAKLGTAQNPDANPFATGVQLGQAQQRINQQQQQLAMELAQAPLRNALLQQDAALKQAQTEGMLHDRETVVQTQQQLSGLAGLVSKALTESTPEAANPFFFDAVQKTPRIAENPYFQKLWQDVQTSLTAKEELQRLRQNQFAGPQAVLVPSPVKGEPPYTAIQTGPNSFTLPQSSVTEFKTPDGSVFQQRTGAGGTPPGGGGAIDKSVAAEAEKKLNASTSGLALINESLGQISPTTVGPVGAAKELFEKGANIINPGSAGTETTKARATFRRTAQELFNSLKADSQINRLEGARISEIADITKLDESDPTAREKYSTLRDLTAYKALLLSHELNRFATDDVLKNMSLDQANRAFERGHLTPAEAKRWGQLTGH